MRLPLLPTLFLCFVAVSWVDSNHALAQSPTSAPRVLEKIDENQLVTLKGNTHPAAIAKNDLGPVRSNLPMTDLLLVLSRSAEQQAAFDDFVQSQYDSSSPDFHHWLLPAQVGEQFGPSLVDIATISSWLASKGFSVAEVSKDRMTIRFGGTAAQVQAAFHTEIHNLSLNGEKHIANMSDPQIPAALAPVVFGVKALHDFKPKPQHKLGGLATFNSQTGKWQRTSGATPLAKAATLTADVAKPRPDFGVTVGTGSSAYPMEDVAPYDFAAIYNVLPLWNATTPINGTGQTIAIVGTSDINLADISAFRAAFGLPAGLPPIQVKGVNGTDPGICTSTSPTASCTIEDLTENSLDVEWAGAVAPGAQIVLVTAGQTTSNDAVYDSANYVVQNVGVPSTPVTGVHILNVSYGLCELAEGTGGNTSYNNLWQTAAAEGIAVFVAAGDAGAAGCDQGLDTSVPYEAQYGLSVSGISTTPYDTAVGGTDLNWGGTTAAPYWNATNTSTGQSAAGYMPEVPWNDTCTNPLALSSLQQLAGELTSAGYNNVTNPTDAESACQFVVTWYQTIYQASKGQIDISGFVDVAGGGGGASGCTTSDGQTVASCAGGYAKPSWQNGITATDGKRDVPDVSFFAANGFLGSASLICVSEALPTGVTSCTYPTAITGDSSQTPDAELNAEEVGGTSVAAPSMAGVMALINQKAGTPQGNPNVALYTLAGKQTYGNCKTESVTNSSACYFNDVDTGTIAMPCQAGTPNCTAIHTGDTVAVLAGYNAGPAYDMATGLGSLNVANVVNSWTASPSGAVSATVTVTPSPTSISVNQPLTVTVTVAGSGGAPTGNVTLVGAGYSSASQTVSSGSLTFSIPAFGLSGGSDVLTASYSGDSNYALASGQATVTVSKLNPGGITVTPNPTSVPANTAFAVTGTVSGATGGPAPTGTITLSSGGYSSVAVLSAGNYSITVPASTFGAGTVTLTASYSGDGNYSALTGTGNVTITAATAPPPPATFSLTASATTAVAPGSSATSTISVASTTGYTGTTTLTCALNTGGPSNQAGDAPACAITPSTAVAVGGKATATVTTTAATTGALVRPDFRRNAVNLAGLGLASFALLALFGIPAKRNTWQALLGLFALLIALGSLAACGGGGGGGSGSGGGGGTTPSNPGTTAGTYTFTVTATGTPTVSPTPTITFTVTVN